MAIAAGVPAKAFLPVAGRPMVLGVIDALAASPHVGRIVLVGPAEDRLDGCPALRDRIASGEVEWLAPEASPCTSLLSALDQVSEDERVIVTTADHALLKTSLIDHFCAEARAIDADAVAGVARRDDVHAAYPGVRRTGFKFRDGAVCGCNLFAFAKARGRRVVEFWRRVEELRKRPLAVVRMFGPGALLRYAFGRLALQDAFEHASRRMNAVVRPLVLPFPEAAVDVDTMEDWRLVCAGSGGALT